MKFVAKGLRPDGVVVRPSLDAADADGARRALAAQGLQVLAIAPANPLLKWLPGPRGRFSLTLFGQELVSLMDAGLSLVECIEALAEKEEVRANADALARLLGLLRRGLSFSAALEQLPQLFPPLFVAAVRAAEQTGDIRQAVARYLQYRAQLEHVRRTLVAASIYPLVLLVAGALVTGFLMFYVVPRFSRIYEELGTELPLLTQVLVRWGHLLEAHAAPVALVSLLALAATAYGLTRPSLRSWLEPRLWRIPALGQRLRIYELARLYRNLGMLLASGIPLPTAMEMARSLLSPFLRQALDRANLDIRRGQPVSRALHRHQLTTPVALRLLSVGERSGRMAHALDRIAVFYEEDLARWIDWFTRVLEPALMILIGGLIGLIVVLLYLPIFELAENIR